MRDLSRRALLGGAASITLGAGASAQAMRHDLLIRGGEVLDPSQNLRGRRDVAIRNGLVSCGVRVRSRRRSVRARGAEDRGPARPAPPPPRPKSGIPGAETPRGC
jgi:hypothetical protein